ncbi:hypothetical protein Trydic_g23354 [Trypoxylus dichotomus]
MSLADKMSSTMQVRADIQLNPGRKPDWNVGQHRKSILKETPSAPTEFEDMVEIIEAISASLVARKKKVPTSGFTLEL